MAGILIKRVNLDTKRDAHEGRMSHGEDMTLL